MQHRPTRPSGPGGRAPVRLPGRSETCREAPEASATRGFNQIQTMSDPRDEEVTRSSDGFGYVDVQPLLGDDWTL